MNPFMPSGSRNRIFELNMEIIQKTRESFNGTCVFWYMICFLAFSGIISCKDYCYIFILSFSSSMVTLDSSSVVPMTFMSTSCFMVGA